VLHHIKSYDGDWFGYYSLPASLIAVKQGAGRLIRSEDDFGAVVLLDTRVNTKGYGRKFRDAVLHGYSSSDIEDISYFLKDQVQ